MSRRPVVLRDAIDGALVTGLVELGYVHVHHGTRVTTGKVLSSMPIALCGAAPGIAGGPAVVVPQGRVADVTCEACWKLLQSQYPTAALGERR